jgi:hypothetical protein
VLLNAGFLVPIPWAGPYRRLPSISLKLDSE